MKLALVLTLVILCVKQTESFQRFLQSISIMSGGAKKRGDSGSNCPISVEAAPTWDRSLSPANDSVHLKLSPDSCEGKVDEKLTWETSSKLTIKEFVLAIDNSTLIACTGDVDINNLEHFGIHVYDTNFTSRYNVLLRERVVDIKESGNLESIIELWRSEKLLVKSKDFPNQFLRGQEKEEFSETVFGHVRRMKRLRETSEDADPSIEEFLVSFNAKQYRKKTGGWDETISTLKSFALWFRSEFPYYYQGCLHCGNQDSNDCYGLVFPSASELPFGAGRTELYICSKCQKTSRFPRFNAVLKILETRRGRCGEYSILMFQMLRNLGYEVRWVVDWADHVWCEVEVDNKWVHIDPCEAAVDEPLIYEGWGKNQTYIIAYGFNDAQDVTQKYTTKFSDTLLRRQNDGVSEECIRSALKNAVDYLNRDGE